MPKFKYDENEWAILHYCHGCGCEFYPDIDTPLNYCSGWCEVRSNDYYEDMLCLSNTW